MAAVSLDLVVICPAKKTSGDLGAKIGVSVPIMQLAKGKRCIYIYIYIYIYIFIKFIKNSRGKDKRKS